MIGKREILALGHVLRRSAESIPLRPDQEYREITVRLWGKGVVLRRVVTGAEIAANSRLVARVGQFILSRIDARNGALGVVPEELDGAIVSNDFPVFNVNLDLLLPEYLGWLCRTPKFVDECRKASRGTTNRVRLKEEKFLARQVPLPLVAEQRRTVARIEELSKRINETHALRFNAEDDITKLLLSAFNRTVDGAPRERMEKVAPIVRRPVAVDLVASYPELGIRSFGKGTFHKSAISGIELGSKRIYRIEPGDLLFSNVFAWEGAIAVVKRGDTGRFGSHRFIACVPKIGVTTSDFLCFYFLTAEGLEKIREASPGGAGRNRTLGLDALSQIEVPVPSFDKQEQFTRILHETEKLRGAQSAMTDELDALLPAILDRAFQGKL